MKNTNIQYSIVVPLYNEEEVIHETYGRLKEVMNATRETYEIIFVNDGSCDNTLDIVLKMRNEDENINLISFSRRFGYQAAISAGIDYSNGKAIVVIDADLQNFPEVILKMIEKWKQGYDVVYGKMVMYKGKTYFEKLTARLFNNSLSTMTDDVEVTEDTWDFRLIDRKVCDALKEIPEHNRNVRGLVSWLGFKQAEVKFMRNDSYEGAAKYSLKKMLKFIFDVLTYFTYKSLNLANR